jgi:hypothetical protein
MGWNQPFSWAFLLLQNWIVYLEQVVINHLVLSFFCRCLHAPPFSDLLEAA